MTTPAPAHDLNHAHQLLAFLEKHKDGLSPLLILTHDYPDPDALAAALALEYLVEQKFEIVAKIAYGGVIGRMENRAMVQILKIPVHRLRPAWLKRYRQVALVDTQPSFENNSFPKTRQATLVIDQHAATDVPVADLVLIDTECGATCVIVARALLEARLEIPATVATALAYGILSDTLDLYRAHSKDVIDTYLAVLPHADMKALARIQNPPRARSFFVTLSRGIRDAVGLRQVIVSHLGLVGAPDLVSLVAEYLLSYQRAKWIMCTGRYKGRLHVSLRCNNQNAPAADVLRSLFENPKNAGGHGPIAGGSFRVGLGTAEEAWQQIEQELQTRLSRRLRLPARAEFRKLFVG